MIYKIGNKYYILVDGKYVEITFKSENDNVSIIPDRKSFIEKSSKVIAEEIKFDDDFKKSMKSITNKIFGYNNR